jgi:phage N-6-adenine-methyltransferase
MKLQPKNHPGQISKRGGVCLVTDDRRTPRALFNQLNREYRFTLDVAASAENTQLPAFFSLELDGLQQSWAGHRVWCNPPFSAVGAWVEKAWAEVRAGCPLVVMLVPANRTEQPWWQQHVEPFRDRGGVLSVRFLAGRYSFSMPDGTPRSRKRGNGEPPFGVCLLVWQRI